MHQRYHCSNPRDERGKMKSLGTEVLLSSLEDQECTSFNNSNIWLPFQDTSSQRPQIEEGDI